MTRTSVVAGLCLLVACSAPGTVPAPPRSVLRVSTTRGLEPVSPSAQSGTRNFLDLVYEASGKYFSTLEPASVADRYRLMSNGRAPPDWLARRVRHARLSAAQPVQGGVEITLSPGPPPALDEIFIDAGPYEQESFAPDRLVLRRRAPGEPDRIEVIAVASEDEEWRRFLARDVDLNPLLTAGALAYVREVPSVKVIPFRVRGTIALHFNMSSRTFHDAAVRRAVAARLRREAIARFATGSGDDAATTRADDPGTPVGGQVRLIFHEGALECRRAVLVIEQQLVEIGFAVTLAPLDVPALVDAVQSRSFDALVFPGGDDATFTRNLRTGSQQNISGYGNPELDRALDAGDMDAARRILEQDVPLTPLFASVEAVAIDGRFCNVRPIVGYDYTFLADIHPCRPGEVE